MTADPLAALAEVINLAGISGGNTHAVAQAVRDAGWAPVAAVREAALAEARAEVAEEAYRKLRTWADKQRAQAAITWNPQPRRDLESYAMAYDNAAVVVRLIGSGCAEGSIDD